MQKLHAVGFTRVQSPTDNPQVAGRISHFATNWKSITEDQWVLRTVQGFLIPFREEPRQMHLTQPCRYSEDQMNLLREEVTSLVRKGAVVTVDPSALEKGFLFDPFLSTQVGRSNEASHQPQIPQFLGASTALQDGGDSYATRDCSAGRLVGQTGSEGCVLHSPDRSGTSKVPSFCGGPSPISIYVSPVWSVLRSLGVHQGSKTGCCSPKRFRSSPYCLYRRYAGDRKIPSRNSGSRGGVDRSIRRSGVHNQQGEVRVDSISTDRVSGSSGGSPCP